MFELIMFWVWVTVISYLYIAPVIVYSIKLLWLVCATQLHKTILPKSKINSAEIALTKLLGHAYPLKYVEEREPTAIELRTLKELEAQQEVYRTMATTRRIRELRSCTKTTHSWGRGTEGISVAVPTIAGMLFIASALVLVVEGDMSLGSGMLVHSTNFIATFLAKYTSWLAPLVLLVVAAKLLLIKTVNFFVNASTKLAKMDKFIEQEERKQ